ncbi:MAG: hypothetical protein QI223_06305 [Candidatus Korarchaeota archaeon]|nr:hypothetical protein [Candidatus Korarchaeota archaeon]
MPNRGRSPEEFLRVYVKKVGPEGVTNRILISTSQCPSCRAPLRVDWASRSAICDSCGWSAELADSHILERAAELTRRSGDLLREAATLLIRLPALFGRLDAASSLARSLFSQLRSLAELAEEDEVERLER